MKQWVWKNGHFFKTVKFCFVQKTFKDYYHIKKSVKAICTLIFESYRFYVLTNFTIHFTLCLIIYIYMYIYIYNMNLSRHQQVCLMRLFWMIQRYFSHYWAWLNIFMTCKFIVLRALNRQPKIYAIYICDTQSAQILQK